MSIQEYVKRGIQIEGVSKAGKVVTIYKDLKDYIERVLLRDRLGGRPLTQYFDFGSFGVGTTDEELEDLCLSEVSAPFRYCLHNVICEKSTFVIPNYITILGDSCLSNNQALESIVIPETVEEFGKSIFFDDINLRDVEIQKADISISDGMFHYCTSLEEIKGSEKIKGVGLRAFANSGLKRFNFGDNFQYADSAAFESTNLEEVVFGENTKALKSLCFNGCDKLKSVDLSKTNLSTISASTFAHCSALTSVKFSNKLKAIRGYAFSFCDSLSSIEFPETLEMIESHAFKATRVEVLKFPKSLILIGLCAFEECCYLKSVVVESKATLGLSCFSDCAYLESADLKGVVNIGRACFQNCYALKDLNVENVTVFDAKAFYNCSGLKEIYLSSAEEIRREAFSGCSSLQVVHMPENRLKVIDNDVFLDCPLEKVYVTKGTYEEFACKNLGLPIVYR